MRELILPIVLLVIFSSSQPVICQESIAKTYKNAVTFNIVRLAFLEARFGYERNLTERNKARATVGIQFPVSSGSFKNISTLLPYYYKVSHGIYLSLGYSYIFNPKSRFYISPEIYFNYNTYDKKYYEYLAGTDMDSYISLESMDLTKSGIKFLIGKKASLAPWKKTRLEFDLFAGIGIQYYMEKLITYAKTWGSHTGYEYFDDPANYYDPPKEEIKIYWLPSLHGGVLLSFPF